MKTTCLILLVILIHLQASGQSISTSPTADSLVLKNYQANSRAILDTLIRFEFTKQRFKALSDYNFELIAEKNKLSTLNTSLSNQNDDCWLANNQLVTQNKKLQIDNKVLKEKNAISAKKIRRSSLEKWSWRSVGIIAVLIKLSPYF